MISRAHRRALAWRQAPCSAPKLYLQLIRTLMRLWSTPTRTERPSCIDPRSPSQRKGRIASSAARSASRSAPPATRPLTSLAREYAKSIKAPIKAFVTIPDAGHFALFMKPEVFLAELTRRVHPLLTKQ